jgi:hypothetical protein
MKDGIIPGVLRPLISQPAIALAVAMRCVRGEELSIKALDSISVRTAAFPTVIIDGGWRLSRAWAPRRPSSFATITPLLRRA